MEHSDWMQPTQDEVQELEYTQLEDNNGNGKGSGNPNTSVSVNGGLVFVLLIAIIFGLWKQCRTSQHSTSES